MNLDLSNKSPLYAFVAVTFAVFLLSIVIGTVALSQEHIKTNYQTTSTYTVNNETGGWINASGYTAAAAANSSFVSLANVRVLNYTDGTTIQSGNYSVATTTGIITNATAINYDNISWTYTYVLHDNPDEFNATTSFSQGLLDYSGLSGVALIIIVLAIVVMIVFGIIHQVNNRA